MENLTSYAGPMQHHRLGVFGGTFDPPHLGHVAALRAAWSSGRYDQLLVTVAGNPYQKSASRVVAAASLRLAMAHAAFDGLVGVKVSDREIVRGGVTYTVDTVRELVAEQWRVELLLGADAANELDQWHDAQALSELVTVAILPRRDTVVQLSARWQFELLAMDPVDLSSSYLRAQVVRGVDVANLLPPGVIALYGVPRQ